MEWVYSQPERAQLSANFSDESTGSFPPAYYPKLSNHEIYCCKMLCNTRKIVTVLWSHVALFRQESQGTLQTLGARSRERCEWVILLEWNTLPFHTQICVYMCAFIFLDTLVLVIYPFVLQIITCCRFNWMQIYSSLPVLNSLQLNSCCVLGVINLHKIWDGLA